MASIGALKLCVLLVVCLLKYVGLSEGRYAKEEYSFIKSASSWGKGDYDYIIVGGGAAGCALAATLSEKYNVLLLERGGVPFNNPNVTFKSNFHIGLLDKTVCHNFISTDGVINGRAKILGGGTSINAGFYTRANPEFIRKLESRGWDTKLMNESYLWIEKQLVHWPKFSGWQRAVKDALLDAGVSPFNGFTYEHLYGTKVGGTTYDSSGRRHSAAELLASANPSKLTVLTHATVQKIVFDTTGKAPKAKGVIFKDENGKQHEAFLGTYSQSEVIVSSGAIGSPQLLMISGIGPKSDLQKLNIPVVLDNQFVGKGMADSPMNTILIPFKRPVEQSLIEVAGITKFGVYIEATSGYGQTRDSIHYRHGTSSAEEEQPSTTPPKQRPGEGVEPIVNSNKDVPYEEFMGGFILSKVAYPMSTGELRLVNTNVEDNPTVTFNYLRHPDDLKRCVDGVRLVIKVGQSEHITNYTSSERQNADKMLELGLKANINFIPKQPNNTKSLEQYCRDSVTTIWHYYGGCRVEQVVNSEHKVLGVDGLRIVDGSTFTESPGTNPQATVMMMGRYTALKILQNRLGNKAGI
ncbi:protein HOTHEAD [Cajanus cajan]|uniref:protein HOTHEAD n=1 Tax=Cajanus cajan TaxID=3821 RepID=UPI00098DC9E5|nr:protein HOTHEAD [Cajanus cajan]